MAITITGIENRLAVPSRIAMEALYRLHHYLVWAKISNHTFDKYFTEAIGDTLTVKRPFQAKVAAGRTISYLAKIDKTVEIKVDKRYNGALQYADVDETLNIVDYGNRYLRPIAEELAYQYDIAGAQELAEGLFLMDGTPGTALTLREAQFIRAHATKMAIPKNSQNFAVMDPLDLAEISGDLQTVNNPPSNMVEGAIREAYQGKLAGYNVLDSVHIPYLEVAAVPTGATPLIRGASQRGDSIMTDGWTNAGAVVLNKGQLIQIAGVNEVQPRGNRRKTGNVMTFVVTEDVTPNNNGQATINIYPSINAGTTDDTVANPSGVEVDGSTAKADLDASAFQTVDSVPADDAAITVIGRDTNSAEAQSYRQGVWFCGDALEYINVTLTEFESAKASSTQRDPETGVAISYLKDFEIKDRSEAERLDIFFGAKAIYPEIGIRHIGAKV